MQVCEGSRRKIVYALDKAFMVIPTFFAIVWSCQSIYAVMTQGWNVGVPLWLVFGFSVKIHATTVLSVCIFFLYTLYNLNYLLTDVRLPITLSLTAFGFVFYNFTWDVLDYVISGSGNPLISLGLVLGTYLIILIYNKRYHFLKITKWLIVGFIVYGVLMLALGLSGFFQAFHTWAETGVDPHGLLWLIGKQVGIWMWSAFYMKRGGLK